MIASVINCVKGVTVLFSKHSSVTFTEVEEGLNNLLKWSVGNFSDASSVKKKELFVCKDALFFHNKTRWTRLFKKGINADAINIDERTQCRFTLKSYLLKLCKQIITRFSSLWKFKLRDLGVWVLFQQGCCFFSQKKCNRGSSALHVVNTSLSETSYRVRNEIKFIVNSTKLIGIYS